MRRHPGEDFFVSAFSKAIFGRFGRLGLSLTAWRQLGWFIRNLEMEHDTEDGSRGHHESR